MTRNRSPRLTAIKTKITSTFRAGGGKDKSVMARGRPKGQQRTPDSTWLREQVRRSGLQQKDIADLIDKDSSTLSYMLKGKRSWQLPDVVKVSNLFRLPVDEVIRRAGYPELQAQGIPIEGKIAGDARVSTVTSHKGTVLAFGSMHSGAVAYVAETENSPLAAYNGAAFVVQGKRQEGLPPGVFGRLCIVWAEGHLTPLLGIIGRGQQRNTASLTLFGMNETLPVKTVHHTSVVLAILF